MNIKQIETFVRIVETGSFGAAADALHASQSTVSARIKDLERSLGVELFDRQFHRAQLTEKGRELFELAQQLVAFTVSLTQRIGDPSALGGTLRLGVVGLVANTWLPALVAALREARPRLALQIEVGLTRVLMEQLKEARIDMAIVAGPLAEAGLHAEPLGFDDFVWMAGPALATPATPLGPADIARWPVLALPEDSHHHPVVKQWFRAAGVNMKPAVSCNNMNVLARLTAQGQGVSLLPRRAYAAEIAAGRLVVLDTRPAMARVGFALVYRAERVPALAEVVAQTARAVSDLPH